MKLLIIKTSALGDVIQARDSLKLLDSAHVDWVVEEPFKELIEGRVNKTLVVSTKKWRKDLFNSLKEIRSFISDLRSTKYDRVVDLQGNFKSALIMFFARAEERVGYDWRSVPEKINWFFLDRHIPLKKNTIRSDYQALLELPEQKNIKDSVKKSGVFNKVMIGLGSAWINKQLPLETSKELLTLFKAKHPDACFYFLWGTELEKKNGEILASCFENSTLVPKMGFVELEKLMNEMDFFIGTDSFPLHLAGSLRVPTWSIFGPSSGLKYRPDKDPYYQGVCPYGRTFEKRCPVLRTCPTGACLRQKSAQEIWNRLNSNNS